MSNEANVSEVLLGKKIEVTHKVAKNKKSVKLVVSGQLPNSCYKYTRFDLKKAADKSTWELRVYGDYTSGQMCLMMVVPFSFETKLELGAKDKFPVTLKVFEEESRFQTIVIKK